MNLLTSLTDQLRPVFLSPASHFSIYSLAAGFVLGFGFLALRQWRRRGRFRLAALARAFFSRKLILHRSTRADVFYFFVNVFVAGLLIGWACLTVAQVAQFVQSVLVDRFGPRAPLEAPELLLRIAITLAGFLAFEFGYWFDHYLKHRIPVLWETHKTHHTAERLTPWTVWRVHPLDSLLFTNVVAICVGATTAFATYLLGKPVAAFRIDGGNVLLVLFFFTFVQLQHSEVWLPLRGLAGRLLMSPAHHQIHHSIDPAHYNSNLGNALAIYDWLFGTLIVPEKEPQRLAFGVNEPGVDPHGVTQLLLAPVGNVAAALAAPHRRAASGGHAREAARTYSMKPPSSRAAPSEAESSA
jgi:sterol desaturase/sphingolipid hydroxylase (fatty acid hydroxylase superfamily)